MLTKLNSLIKNKDKSYINLIIFELMNDVKIKSALILASLNIHGKTKIVEKTLTRDHTERMLMTNKR